ncbi:MAG TPA: hypothetical protein DCQ76_04745 [Ruminococcaceae bacterium]|nr:hypothetical protein [Oscillospiraceae bacterium]
MVAKTPKEVLEKEFIRTADIRVLMECGEDMASKVMKSVKAFQDSTGGLLCGVCHVDDLKAWMKHNREKGKVRAHV